VRLNKAVMLGQCFSTLRSRPKNGSLSFEFGGSP